jgi:hypothetical protein
MIERKSRHPDAMPFFVSPPAWVLVHETATGELRVSTESDDEGRAILCFLSPLDAPIEAARFAQPGQAYHVMAATQLDGSLFRDSIMVVADNSTCDGVGLFDPEFGQWHVVTPPEC